MKNGIVIPLSPTKVAVALGAATLALIGGLLVLGQDGRIATYTAMIAAAAVSLWWTGFRPFR